MKKYNNEKKCLLMEILRGNNLVAAERPKSFPSPEFSLKTKNLQDFRFTSFFIGDELTKFQKILWNSKKKIKIE